MVHSDSRPAPLPKARQRTRNTTKLDLHSAMHQLLGVDVTGMPGMDPYTVLRIVSETGPTLSEFPSVENFTAWIVSGHEDFWWQNSKQQDCPSSEQSSASVSFGGASSESN